MLQAVDHNSPHMAFMDPICDFLYHIKYMFTGDSVKEQVNPPGELRGAMAYDC